MARIGGKTEYTREDMIELLAAIRAAGDLFLADDVKLPTETRCDAVSELATELEERLLGEVVGTEGDGDERGQRMRTSWRCGSARRSSRRS